MKLIQSEKTGIFSVKYKTQSGKFKTTSLGTTSKREAVMLVKEAKIEEQETLAKVNALSRDVYLSMTADKNIPFQDCINEWYEYSKVKARSANTIYTQSGLLTTFAALHGVKLLSDVTPKNINGWVNSEEEINLNSRRQRLAAIRSLFSYAVANSYVIKDPTAMVAVDASKLSHKQKETRSREPFTKSEYNKMVKRAPYFMKEAVMLGWWTGLRIIDISKLEWDSWGDDHLTVWTEKQDKRVHLPYDNPLIGDGVLRDMLQDIEYQDKKYCFPEWAELADDPKRRSRFSVYFKRFLERIEIEGKSFHCLRHSFVTRVSKEVGQLDYDSTLQKIASWVGHSSTQTTKGYLHH